MRDLFDLLRANPILLIILIGWIVSMLGGVVRRAVERQQREQRQQQRKQRPQQKSAEEIAAELRRMMGMERETRVEVREPPAPPARPVPPAAASLPGALDDVDAAREARRLRRTQELAEAEARRRARAEVAARAEGRPLPKPPPQTAKAAPVSLSERMLATTEQTLGQLATQPRTPKRQRRSLDTAPPLARRRVDLRDPARAIVLAEIFGTPLALRPTGTGTGTPSL